MEATPVINKPKGEWTAEWLMKQTGMASITEDQADRICQGHNAALAAERDEHEKATIAHGRALRELDKQLAAERERKLEEVWKLHKGVDPDTGEMWLTPRMERDAKVTELSWEIQQLREQLADERENTKDAQEEAFAAYAEVDAIREQLDAEREQKEWLGRMYKSACEERDQLRGQLAAEREANRVAQVEWAKQLAAAVEALEFYAKSINWDISLCQQDAGNVATSALAKLEGK